MSATLLDNRTDPNPAGEDDVSRYLSMIRTYPRLTPEQERELARRCADGDEDAIRTMVYGIYVKVIQKSVQMQLGII